MTEENDPAQINDEAEWITFTVKNLYEWHKPR